MRSLNVIGCALAFGGAIASFSATASDETLKNALDEALKIISSQGYGQAAQDAMVAGGLTELAGSGLHIFAFDNEGKIIFDLSGQTTPGLELAGIMDMEGKETIAYSRAAAEGENGGYYHAQGNWPHPTQGTVVPSSMYCNKHEANVVCSMMWHP